MKCLSRAGNELCQKENKHLQCIKATGDKPAVNDPLGIRQKTWNHHKKNEIKRNNGKKSLE